MNKLKELRLQHKKTQKDLANFLNVTPKAISFYELGQRDIPNDALLKLADVYHVTTDELLGRDAPPAASDRLLFDEREREHIKKYRAMTDEHREAVDAQIDFFYKKDAEARVKSGSVQAGRNFAG